MVVVCKPQVFILYDCGPVCPNHHYYWSYCLFNDDQIMFDITVPKRPQAAHDKIQTIQPWHLPRLFFPHPVRYTDSSLPGKPHVAIQTTHMKTI